MKNEIADEFRGELLFQHNVLKTCLCERAARAART